VKRIPLLIIVLVNTGFVFAQECSPTFREIFDFNVGDYFEYQTGHYDYGSFPLLITYTTRTQSYIITERFEKGDTLFYARKGNGNILSLYNYGDGYSEDTLGHSEYLILDTLIYIDSTAHYLNKCAGTLIEAKNAAYCCSPHCYATIQVEQNDSLITKKVVGSWYPDNCIFGKTFGQGLGLVLENDSYWEISNNTLLRRYRKATQPYQFLNAEILNGDTVYISSCKKSILQANKSNELEYLWYKDGILTPGADSDAIEVSKEGAYQVLVKKGNDELNVSTVCIVLESYDINIGSDSLAVVGSLIEIPISTSYVCPADSIISFQFDFTYDASVLEYLFYENAGTLAESGTLLIRESFPGYLHAGYMSTSSINGSGTIVKLKFRPINQGNSPLEVSNFFYNADTVRQINNGSVTAIRYGDVDNNGSIQAYDAALTLQNSAGMDPLPAIDPVPWELWRNTAADVDRSPGISAYDASLILRKSIGLISEFPTEESSEQFRLDMADIDIQLENNEIIFYSVGKLFGLNLSAGNTANLLGTPAISESSVIYAFNNENGKYMFALASAFPPAEHKAIIKIPIIRPGKITLDLLINSFSRTVTLDLLTGNADQIIGNIRIYPNPAEDRIKIDGIKKPVSITVYNMNGESLLTRYVTGETEDINISDLPEGIYILKLSNDQQFLVRKFVKL
jgi:hypothetical protein